MKDQPDPPKYKRRFRFGFEMIRIADLPIVRVAFANGFTALDCETV